MAYGRFKRAEPNRRQQAKGLNYGMAPEITDAQIRLLIDHINHALLSLGYGFLVGLPKLVAVKLEGLVYLLCAARYEIILYTKKANWDITGLRLNFAW